MFFNCNVTYDEMNMTIIFHSKTDYSFIFEKVNEKFTLNHVTFTCVFKPGCDSDSDSESDCKFHNDFEYESASKSDVEQDIFFLEIKDENLDEVKKVLDQLIIFFRFRSKY